MAKKAERDELPEPKRIEHPKPLVRVHYYVFVTHEGQPHRMHDVCDVHASTEAEAIAKATEIAGRKYQRRERIESDGDRQEYFRVEATNNVSCC